MSTNLDMLIANNNTTGLHIAVGHKENEKQSWQRILRRDSNSNKCPQLALFCSLWLVNAIDCKTL